MSSWTKVRRTLGGSDPRHWRVPGFLEMRLRGDHARRAVFSIGVGFGIAGPLAGIMLAIAPPDQIGMAVLLSVLLAVAMSGFVFMMKDAAAFIISLEEDGLRRRYKPMLLNLFGWRDRDEFWAYDSMRSCGIVPLGQFNGKYSVIVIAVPDQTFTVIVPSKIDIKEVAAFLAAQCPQVKAIQQIPPQARPQPSVGSRGMVVSAVMAGAGILLALIGSVARLAIYNDGGKMDSAAVAATVKAAPEGASLRECLVSDKDGVKQAKISPDGRWVWAYTSGKNHLVWNDQQTDPVGELEIPAANGNHFSFTPDSQRLIVVADRDVHVWQLEPLQQQHQFSVEAAPDHVAVTADGQQLIVVTMSSIRLYDLETGQPNQAMPITLGAVVDATVSADGNRLIIAQQPRILSVRLDNGAVEELIAYQAPSRAHLQGRLGPGGRWAAMQSKQGTVLYDLDNRQRAATVAAGPMYANPVISPDGTRLAIGTMQGVGVWDTVKKKPVVRFALSNSTMLDLSDNGKCLLGYASRLPKLVVWEMPR